MIPAPQPSNESQRLEAIQSYQILDTLPEEVYDDITRLATEICGTPIALFTIVDKDRQWFKSKQGMAASETPRDYAFCAHAILNPDEPLVVEDARYDERFHDNPLTTGDPHVVFYAGIPVKDDQGYALGSICVIDNRPRELPEYKLDALKALSRLISTHLKLRRAELQLEKQKTSDGQVSPLLDTLSQHVDAMQTASLSADQQGQMAAIKQDVQNLRQALGK